MSIADVMEKSELGVARIQKNIDELDEQLTRRLKDVRVIINAAVDKVEGKFDREIMEIQGVLA